MNTKLLLLSLSLAATSAFAQQTLGSGIDKANMDLSVKPGNDFYRYAAGGWMKSHPLDAEHPMNGAFVDLEEQNQKRIRDCLQRVVDPDDHIPDPAALEVLRTGGQQRPNFRQLAVPRFQRGIEIIYDPVST